MKLKTPTFPRKGHHQSQGANAQPPRLKPSPTPDTSDAAASGLTPATALKRATGGLTTPTRQRNSAAMFAGLAFIIIAGALAAQVAASFDDSIDVLVAERSIEEGQPVSPDDFRTVQIAAAAGDIEVLSPDSIDDLVGRVAAGPIGAGSMIHPDQFTVAFGEQKILVGALLEPNQYPAGGLKEGDQVRLIATASRSFSSDDDENSRLSAGQEVTVGEIVHVEALSNNQHFSIRVPESSANIVVQLVSEDLISLGLLDDGVTLEPVSPVEAGSPADPQEFPSEPDQAESGE